MAIKKTTAGQGRNRKAECMFNVGMKKEEVRLFSEEVLQDFQRGAKASFETAWAQEKVLRGQITRKRQELEKLQIEASQARRTALQAHGAVLLLNALLGSTKPWKPGKR